MDMCNGCGWRMPCRHAKRVQHWSLDVEDRDLEFWVSGHPICKFMHDLSTAEIYRPGVSLSLILSIYLHPVLNRLIW